MVSSKTSSSGSGGGEHAGRLRLLAPAPSGSEPPVLELRGEFDLDTVPEIDRFLRRTLGPLYHQQHLVIDLERTTFVDSSFIAFLVRERVAARDTSGVQGGGVRRVLAGRDPVGRPPGRWAGEGRVSSRGGCRARRPGDGTP